MQKLTDQERLRPWMGFVLYGVAMALFCTVCVYMQSNWGIAGLVLTELLLAGLAVLFAVVRKVKISEVFPIKKFSVRDFFGCLLLLIGGYLVSILSVFVMIIIFPDSASEITSLSGFLYDGSMNYIVTVIVVALLPGICEESLYRGAILSSFRSFDKEWICIVLVGLFFSINHLSLLRGPFTFIIGMLFAYVMVKKNNILLTMMMHFGLNFFSATVSYISFSSGNVSTAGITPDMASQSLGAFLVIGFATPLLLVTGFMLINPEGHKWTRYVIAGVIAAVMLLAGVVLTVISSTQAFFSMNGSYEVTGEAFESGYFTVTEEREYSLIVVMTNADGFYHASLQDRDGEIACESDMGDGTIKTYTSTLFLNDGEYEVVIVSDDDTVGQTPQYSIMLK
ncbi:MAG: CPBP family intramembrane metalloprotease [Lachnospiraceae bacterium]|nr:CPBP family intramembrane metalloprotease [Lachnospiraceae bacterium]